MAAYPDPPPVIPVPESLAAQGPYVRLSCPGLARARNVSRHWGPPRACHRAPCCEKGGPSGPKESSGWSPRFPPVRAGTTKGQRSHARRPPLGQPQLNVPRERSRPRGRPLQPRFPKEHHHRRAADDSLCGLVPQSNVVVSLEMEREGGGGRSWPPPQRRRSAPQGLLLSAWTQARARTGFRTQTDLGLELGLLRP